MSYLFFTTLNIYKNVLDRLKLNMDVEINVSLFHVML